MTITDNLDVYITLKTLETYCKGHIECDKCKMTEICEYLSISPCNIDVEYKKKARKKQEKN
jgi:hypothetical protein